MASATKATKTSKLTISSAKSVPRNIQATMLVAVVAGFLFVKPYISTILFSALIAFIFNPVYLAALRRTKRQGLALTATIATALLSLILPLFIVIAVTVGQANTLVDQFNSGDLSIGPAQVEEVVNKGTERVNEIVRALPGGESLALDKQKISQSIKNIGTAAVQRIINFIEKAGGAVAGLVSTSILSLFLIISLLRYQDELMVLIRKLSPFHDSITSTYLNRAGAMTKGMVKGQLIIAVVQGFASAASLWLVGLDYFWFFFMVLSFLSFIPLGAGILTIPIGIVIMLTGNFAQGLFVILFHMFGVSNIDNLLRPRLVPKTARLNSALTLLAVFSGLAVFGAAGVIYGPVIMILLITTIHMYADYNSQTTKSLPPS